MTDPERSKGREKGSIEVRKKGKKVQCGNTVNEQEAPDTLICNRCKGIFTNVNAKMICCDRCQKWYCTKCVNITDAFYSFLASKEADDIAWFCKACKEPAKNAIIEDKCIEDKCKEYTKKINENEFRRYQFQSTGILYEISTNSFSWGGLKNFLIPPQKIVSVCFERGLKN